MSFLGELLLVTPDGLATNPLNPALRRNLVKLPPTLPTVQQEAAGVAIALLG